MLFSLQVFWSSIFNLPKAILRLLEEELNGFLWGGKDEKAKAKVSWEKVCAPKEGRLGIKRLDTWNQAAMLRHIWNLFA